MRIRVLLAFACAFSTSLISGWAAPSAAQELWYDKVEPLFDKNCFKCHGGVKQKGGLDLRSLQNILRGGEHGPAIFPGRPDESHIFQFAHPGADPHMPPDEKKQLAPGEIAIIKDWISKLPAAKSLASLTNANGVSDYLAAMHRQQKPNWTPPPGMTAPQVIDSFIALGWHDRKVKPAPLADDATFVRRAFLDIAGRIPTPGETDEFLKNGAKNKRTLLVDKLLGTDDYARHLAEIFDVVLLGRRGDRVEGRRKANHWFEYLETAFRENRAWDKVVRDLIVCRPGKPEEKGAVVYLYERKDNFQEMAEAIAPLAFGVQIGCAQCHNHPLAAEIEQRHYWGLVAALNRSKNVDSKSGPGIAEAATGGFVSFANLKKESQPALLALLNGKVVDEKRPAPGEKEKDLPELYVVPPAKEKERPESPAVPKFSRRAALADAVTHDNPMLARALVNRIWALMLGRGLVQPVDQMDSRHRPSHPDLLDWLARDFEASGCNVKRLVRNIALSRVYQLDSRWKGPNPPLPNAFARALEKPLTAEQLYRSLLVASGQDLKAVGQDADGLRQSVIARFPDVFVSEHNASLQQALFFSNSPLMDGLLKKQPGNTTGTLVTISDLEARIDKAFRIVLGRPPEKDELANARAFLAKRDPEAGVKQFVWALLASAEFQVNH
jgi:hypothetical protein